MDGSLRVAHCLVLRWTPIGGPARCRRVTNGDALLLIETLVCFSDSAVDGRVVDRSAVILPRDSQNHRTLPSVMYDDDSVAQSDAPRNCCE